jgi:DNA ligase-1
MRRFARLFEELDASTATGDKVAAMVRYFAQAPAEDAAWAVYFLCGGKPRQVVPTALLRAAACSRAQIDDWLFEASYQVVGDLAETIAHVLPPASQVLGSQGLAHWVLQRLLPLRGLPPDEQETRVLAAWDELDTPGRFLFVKLIGGGFRVGVSKLLVQRALAEFTGLDARLLAQRLVGWTAARATPDATRWLALIAAPGGDAGPAGLPYPFFLAHALAAPPETLGPVDDWQIEWKYDGARAQIVKRQGQVWIWSRGEELITESFPEVAAAAQALSDGTVLDGELLVWLPGQALPAGFAPLQQRLHRKQPGKKLLADAPVRFVAYDLLEEQGQDLRTRALHERRALLQAMALPGAGQTLALSLLVSASDWAQAAELRQASRERGVEGLMLKQRSSRYGSGRTKADGTWWKWKIDPLSVDAVLIYAQAGHGRRAGVYTDYSFAVWSRPPANADEAQAVLEAIAQREPAVPGALQLLSFAKAYSGLSDAEFQAVDRVIRATTVDKFGPVRSLRPSLVFEIGFEGIHASPRHKSGLAVRFPRMLRIRYDKAVWEADAMPTLQGLLTQPGSDDAGL